MTLDLTKPMQTHGPKDSSMSERMSDERLKPCPFCGSDGAKLVVNRHAEMSWVSCVNCGLEAPSETGVSADDAVAYWNRRAADAGTAEPVAITPSPDALAAAREAGRREARDDIKTLIQQFHIIEHEQDQKAVEAIRKKYRIRDPLAISAIRGGK